MTPNQERMQALTLMIAVTFIIGAFVAADHWFAPKSERVLSGADEYAALGRDLDRSGLSTWARAWTDCYRFGPDAPATKVCHARVEAAFKRQEGMDR